MPARARHAQPAAEPRARPAAEDEARAADRPPVSEQRELYRGLASKLEAGEAVAEERSALIDQALAVWARPGFETFMCLPRLRFEPFPYQLEAASRVLRHMQGRAVLADEVGLGKTIEAGLVLSELRLRGLATRSLVLAPAGLVSQWCEELERKFALPCAVADLRWLKLGGAASAGGVAAAAQPILVASLAAARRDPLRAALVATDWEVVIADEAHRLKNPRSASAQLVRSLRARSLLLLTATPIENRLADLFQLVSLVRPGLLGCAAEFRSRHGGGDGVRNLASLQLALRELMVRHRRSEISVMLPSRVAETVCVSPSAEEARVYRAISERVRAEGRDAGPARTMALRSAQQLAGSSPWACVSVLQKLGWGDLASQAAAVPSTGKVQALLALLAGRGELDDKVVVFTASRRTLEHLRAIVERHGIDAAIYHGSLSRAEKDAAIASFADGTPVLLSTEAAGEGRNLQFCHTMINFDLPWNPMRIEQRLGRIHRIGQTHEVRLTNLVARGTLEERLLEVLQAKINLFELVVGELDMILGRIDEELDFETVVFQHYVESRDDSEFASRLESVGERLAQARLGYLQTRERIDGLIGAEAQAGP